MRFRHANIMILLAAIGSFLPLVMVPSVLEGYVRTHETRALQRTLDGLAGQIRDNVHEGLGTLGRLLADAPALCGPEFLAAAQAAIRGSLLVRDVAVTDRQGATLCDALGGGDIITPLSQETSLPGRSEKLAVVRLGSLDAPVFRLSAMAGETRRVSVFVPVLAIPLASQLADLHSGLGIRVSLAGQAGPILSAGPGATLGEAARINTRALTSDLPIEVAGDIPMAAVRSDYADFSLVLTVATGLLSGALLLLMLTLAKRMALPDFDLERAIEEHEITPYYQPVIDLVTGRLAGCEVLARWVKPNGDAGQPGPFIDYAEMTGLAVPMTLSIMRQVAADLGELCRARPDLRISINLFDGHFRDTAIVEDVAAIFGNSGIRFPQLVFEITERRPLPETPSAAAVIGGLHGLGARLAMDDVGTGHSNLAYMQTLGVDVVKIDRIFLQMIAAGTSQAPVLDGLIGMARDLGTEIVAEGVETADQAVYLRGRGVRLAQGYFFAPALRREAFIELAGALEAELQRTVERPLPAVEAA